MFNIKKLFVVLCCIYSGFINADQTIFQLNMEENSFFPRNGTLNVIIPDINSSPYPASPDFAFLDTGIWIDVQWDSICSSNAALAGGQLTGWLLGPALEGTLPGLNIDDTHDQFRGAMGLGPGNTATTLYAVLAGDFIDLPGIGTANRFLCSGETDTAEYAILYVFLWPNATTFADKGFYIGDVFYLTEIGIQHYFLYNSEQLL